MEQKRGSELAWDLEDYRAHEVDPPESILSNPQACEGDLMTDEEVAQFVKDGIATIMLLRDKGSERTKTVHETFLLDCEFLLSLGRLEQDEYNELIDLENYSF